MNDPEPPVRTHLVPRTRAGRIAAVLFLVLMAMAQPPIVHGPVNRIAPWIGDLPFLFAYLLVVYAALIGVLVWARRQRL